MDEASLRASNSSELNGADCKAVEARTTCQIGKRVPFIASLPLGSLTPLDLYSAISASVVSEEEAGKAAHTTWCERRTGSDQNS